MSSALAAHTVRATAEDLWPPKLLVAALYSLCSIPLTSKPLLKTSSDIQFPFYMAPTVKSTVLFSCWGTDPNSSAVHPPLPGCAPASPRATASSLQPPNLPFSSATSYSERCPHFFFCEYQTVLSQHLLAWLLFSLRDGILQNQIPPVKELGAFLRGTTRYFSKPQWDDPRPHNSSISESMWSLTCNVS